MNEKIRRFLIRSAICLVIECVVVFGWLAWFMTGKTKRTISEISEIYMYEMNIQLQQKFSSLIKLRLEQVEGIIKRTPPGGDVSSEQLKEQIVTELETSSLIRGFSYLGFYTEDNTLETIYGKDVEIITASDVQESLKEDGNLVEQGINKDHEKLLLLGKAAEYELEDGGRSCALVAGISMDYLSDAMYLDTGNSRVYSHIIDKNGKFIIRSGDVKWDSYYDRIRNDYDVFEEKTSDQYLAELQAAIAAKEVYFTFISVDGERRQIYCSPIASYSPWYLISIMPSGDFNEAVSHLDNVRMGTLIGSSLILLMSMSFVFMKYFNLSQHQVKELNEAKQEADRANKAKSEFLSSMSHDIRTPMNAIIGMTDIALKNSQDPERVEDCLKKVKLSSKHLLGLINDVLDMSKIESGKMTLHMGEVSLRETMDDIINIMRAQVKDKKQFFDIFIQNIESEDIYCDSVRLNQVLLNILSNAVKFTPEDGRIDIYLYQEPSPKGNAYVRTHFKIRDNGIGMSKEFQKQIFHSFSRENTEQVQNIAGTGLGMAITKSIVEMMEGTIELWSEQGKGSEFHVILDFGRAKKKETDMKLPGWRILVVDDNEELCASTVANLEELGVYAESTTDGRKAIEMIEEHHKRKDDYQVVLIDWKMPGMDGIQITKEIRKRISKRIPIFLISAYDLSEIENQVQEEEIRGFIPKPLFKSTLFYCLRQYEDSSRQETAPEEDKLPELGGRRILVAEDVDLNWEIAKEILSSVGLQADRAVNGQVCVEKFSQSEIGYYDMILMDIRMPVMNGYDAAKAIRALRRSDKNLPIFAMTADAFSGDIQYSLDCGMNGHIAKPIDIRELIQLLQTYLR